MNGDILCNGHSTLPNYLIHCNSKTSREEVDIIEGKSQMQGECIGRRHAIVSPDSSGINNEQHEAWPCEGDRLPLQSYPSVEVTTGQYSSRAFNHSRETRRKVKVKKSSQRREERKNTTNRKVTDYFPVRRSSRKSKSELECEEKKHIDELILKGIENGMTVQHIESKGRGIFATQSFQKGQYVVEYYGDLLQIPDAKKRETMYAQDPSTGCYMYYFQYLSKTYCVDATTESGRMGRLINHSRNGNCHTKLHDINGIPHLILVASRDIDKGEELLYDYGDRRKTSIAAHPWLKQ
ncbi:N-lysine methyltransferase KMT5A-A [Clupea harengus]|uniref:[histone H4]-lysine(20) N-methyltransferase n=1 Tax=Clupea harengus TaxID=7950 RepID=A0A6P3VFI2_CLUHA|nr:N-lysine methyltransferase KMT5A-A [Clupea harengus]